MTVYVLMPPHCAVPIAVYRSCAEFGRENNCDGKYVANRIKEKGKFTFKEGVLWPTPEKKAKTKRKGRDI